MESISRTGDQTNLQLDLPLMKCGCVANSVTTRKNGISFDPGIPSCAVHDCIEQAVKKPSLEGRKAKCGMCSKIVDSNYALPFFEYRGPGSPSAQLQCKCGYFEVAHKPKSGNGYRIKCNEFIPHGAWEYDLYYSGCRGWD